MLPTIALGFVSDPPVSNRGGLVDKDVIITPFEEDKNPLRKDKFNIKIAGVRDVLAQDRPGGNHSKIGTDLAIKHLFSSGRGGQVRCC